MKEEGIGNKLEHTASLTLNEDVKTIMTKVFKDDFPICFVHEVHFLNFVEMHEVGAEQNLNWKLELVLASHS